MLALRIPDDAPLSHNIPLGLPPLVQSVGHKNFGAELLSFLNMTCEAEHCTVFRLNTISPSEIVAVSRDGTDTAHQQFSLYVSGSYWKRDVDLSAALVAAGLGGLTISRTDIRSMPAGDFRSRVYARTSIRERILLCGEVGGFTIGMSILRLENRGTVSEQELSNLANIATTLMSLVGKHAEMLDMRAGFLLALTSRERIEGIMRTASPRLPLREAQVCSRILYGLSTPGMSCDLGIGEETVMTYRKRAYQRLGISSQRELLLWYVTAWAKSDDDAEQPAAPPPQRLLG